MKPYLSLKQETQQAIDLIQYELKKLPAEAFLTLSEDDRNIHRYNLALFRSQQIARNPWAYPSTPSQKP